MPHSTPPADDAHLPQSSDADATLPGRPDEPSNAPMLESAGTRIGPYKLLQVIGQGGFGTVFMAEQEQPVRRKVALKIIKLGMDTHQVVARFEQERQALAMMDHPNIARVFDAGATEAGRPYFVMELVKGDPIVDYCDKQKLGIRERLELFSQVCAAVQHAHTKGIIHRDLKPSNILVSVQDGRPAAKVIDFGVAKATSARLTEMTLFTEHRQLIGTPEYMSPEQAEGSLDIDTRTDVYSLGVLLYELLTGSTPFDSRRLRSAAFAEIQRIIREVEPPRPSTRISQSAESLAGVAAKRQVEPRKLGMIVRGELDWIVMKAMEKDRQRRYETATGLASDVQRYLTGQAVLAAPPSAMYRTRKFVARHRGAVAAGSILAVTLLLGIAAFAWQASIARHERDRAVLAETAMAQRADELAKVSEFQAGMLNQIDANAAGAKLMEGIRADFAAALQKAGTPEAERTARTGTFGRELERVNGTDTAAQMIDRTILTPAVMAIDAQFKEQPTVDARLRHTLSKLYSTLGMDERALAIEEAALAASRRAPKEDERMSTQCVNAMGILLDNLGRYPEAERCYQESLAASERLNGPEHADTLNSLSCMANFLRARGRFAEAEPMLRRSVELNQRVLGARHRDTLIALNCLGFLYAVQGKAALAEPLWREAYESGRAALGDDNPDVMVWANNLAGLLQDQGKYQDAELVFRDSVARYRRVMGQQHPQTLQVILNHGGALSNQGKFDQAEALFREALESSTRALSADHPMTMSAMSMLGDLLIKQGRLAEAEPYVRGTLTAWRRTQGADHADSLSALAQLARLKDYQWQSVEAESLYREAVERSTRALGAEHPATLWRIQGLGLLCARAGKLDEAETLLKGVLETQRRIHGDEHPTIGATLGCLALVAQMRGNLVEAEQLARQGLGKLRKTVGDDHPLTLNAIGMLADTLRLEDKLSESVPLFREATERLVRRLGKQHAITGVARLRFGMTLTRLKQHPDAEAELLEAEHICSTAEGVQPGKHRECVEALIALYQEWELAEPGVGHAEKAAQWKAARDGAAVS